MKNLLKIARIAGSLIAVLGVLVLLSFVSDSQDNLLCKSIKISIVQHNETMEFVDKDVIRTALTDLGSPIVDRPMAELDLNNYERILLNMPEIEAAQVYKTIDGELRVEVTQRTPIVRVLNADGTSFYIDQKGRPMPLSSKYTARVMIASGALQEPMMGYSAQEIAADDSLSQALMFDDIYKLANFVEQDEFWKAQVQHITITPQGEFEIIPRVGRHTILFGDITDMEKKFKKLMVFYDRGLKNADWNVYKTINLKYKDQIVGTKY